MPVLDSTRSLADLHMDTVPAELVGVNGGAAAAVERTLDEVAVAQAAEQTGGAQRCLDMAVDYAKARVAFSRPIGSFQAIKHKCASLYLDIEAARAALYHAAWSISVDAADVALVAAATAADCSEVFVRAAAENIQIHGGVGFTWEHDAHLYLKRARAAHELFGSPTRRYEQVAQLLGV
jgi:alkylation response protein AidB-like acyl-CoA dehydrogenase